MLENLLSIAVSLVIVVAFLTIVRMLIEAIKDYKSEMAKRELIEFIIKDMEEKKDGNSTSK